MTEARLDILVSHATVWLGPDDDTGTQWGSGFFVAPEWVLSCAHVLLAHRHREETAPLRVVGAHIEAEARAAYWVGAGPDPEQDLVLLHLLDGARSRHCVRLSDRIDKPHRVTAHGRYVPRRGAVPRDWSGQCEVNGTDGPYGLTLGGADIPHGASGGPALDRDHGVVAGVVKARKKERGGGLAIAVTALRGFDAAVPVAGEDGLGADPYRALIRAHDQWHQEQATRSSSWVAVQEGLGGGGERRWTARDSAAASALLAELPPPASTADLVSVIGQVLGEDDPVWPGTAPPRDWRDGHGWLYESADGDDIAFLHYLQLVARRLPERSGALRHWVRARAERLPGRYRALLTRTGPAPRKAHADHADPAVAVELRPDVNHPDNRFHWRVWTWSDGVGSARPAGQSDSADGDPLIALPALLSEPLQEAFDYLDTDQHPARLEVVLPVEHFDLDVHLWRCHRRARSSRPLPADRLFGVHRQVVLRCLRRGGPAAEAWLKRWSAADTAQWGLHALPLAPSPYSAPVGTELDVAAPGAVPVLCRPAADSIPALRRLIGFGYGLALWSSGSRHPGGCSTECHELYRRTAMLFGDTGRAAALPEELRVLRERISQEDPDADWADPLALMYDDPRRPLPTGRLSSP